MKGKHTQIIIELVASLAFMTFPLILFPTVQPFVSEGILNPALKGILIAHSLLIAFYFFNSYYAIPKFYFTKKKSTYIIIVLSFFTALTLLMLSNPSYNPLPSPPFKYATFTFFFSIFLRFLMVMLVSLGIANIARLKRTEQERIQTELSYLKAQINPHFLFNTLNSIYALTVKKSEMAPEAVTRLAAIMRYVFTDASHDFVSLEKELNYVSSYIELERLRLTDKVNFQYIVNGDAKGKKIAPMILIPLVENAFKHSVSTRELSEIRITIDITENKINLLVKNTKHKTDGKNNTGLGLGNVKRRLSLLYAGKHAFKLEETDKEFSANLELELND